MLCSMVRWFIIFILILCVSIGLQSYQHDLDDKISRFIAARNSSALDKGYSAKQKKQKTSSEIESDRGIIMCSGNHMVHYLLRSIWQIRYLWKSTLGIAVAHCNELTANHIKTIQLMDSNVKFVNVCSDDVEYAEKLKPAAGRFKGFFCKVAALVASPFNDTMVVDLDVVWFKQPELLFDSPGYKQSGAVYFRDRSLVVQSRQHDRYLFSILGQKDISLANPQQVKDLAYSNGLNYFWKNFEAKDEKKFPMYSGYQDSSVVMFNKDRHPITISILLDLLPTFNYGYGDKEIFWIANTMSKEPFVFSPYLAGQYGDCFGVIIHYDPGPLDEKDTSPFYTNAEYMIEHELTYVGQFASKVITPGMSASFDTPNGTTHMDNWPPWGQRGGAGCVCVKYPCTTSTQVATATKSTDIQKYMLLLQYVTMALRVHFNTVEVSDHHGHNSTTGQHTYVPCIPIAYEVVDDLNEIFEEVITKEDCFFIGCPYMPINFVNKSLPWKYKGFRPYESPFNNNVYCDPIVFDAKPLPDMKDLAESARNPNTTWPTFPEEQLVRNSPRDKSVYLFRNGSLHLIYNMHTLIQLGRDIDEIRVVSKNVFDHLPMGDTISLRKMK